MFFPIFFLYFGNSLYHALGIAWIPDSWKIFKKPLTFEYLCFPFIFPYYGNLLFPCFEKCVDAHEKSLLIHEWEICGYSHLSSMNSDKYSQISSKTHNLGMIWLSTKYFHVMGICAFPDIGDCMSFH